MKAIALVLMLFAFAVPGHTREWESATGGHKVQAEYLSKSGIDIELKKNNGKIISLKLNQLSPHDREIVRLMEKLQKAEHKAPQRIASVAQSIEEESDIAYRKWSLGKITINQYFKIYAAYWWPDNSEMQRCEYKSQMAAYQEYEKLFEKNITLPEKLILNKAMTEAKGNFRMILQDYKIMLEASKMPENK